MFLKKNYPFPSFAMFTRSARFAELRKLLTIFACNNFERKDSTMKQRRILALFIGRVRRTDYDQLCRWGCKL